MNEELNACIQACQDTYPLEKSVLHSSLEIVLIILVILMVILGTIIGIMKLTGKIK